MKMNVNRTVFLFPVTLSSYYVTNFYTLLRTRLIFVISFITLIHLFPLRDILFDLFLASDSLCVGETMAICINTIPVFTNKLKSHVALIQYLLYHYRYIGRTVYIPFLQSYFYCYIVLLCVRYTFLKIRIPVLILP